MFGVKDERYIQHAGHSLGLVVALMVGQQIEQVLGEAQAGSRPDLPFAVRKPVGGGDQDRDLSQQSNGLADIRLVRTVGGIGVGHAEQRHPGAQHVHRMGVARHHADERFHRAWQPPLSVQLDGKVVQLLAGRQFAEQEQIGDFLKGRLLRQVADRVPAIAQPGVAFVHLAEGRLAGQHAFEAGSVRREG